MAKFVLNQNLPECSTPCGPGMVSSVQPKTLSGRVCGWGSSRGEKPGA
uniref:KN motif and ankyrin repeat domains 3 n=1 Tax=Mus musculus TaxID=10090 RepID=A0A3Q4L2U8_MOUSE